MRAWDDMGDRVSISIGVKLYKQHPNGGITAKMLMDEVLALPRSSWEMAHVTTSANKPKRHFWRWVVALLLAPIVCWYVATPQVSFHFSDKGQGRLGYILNVQHDISKGEIYPGEATGGGGAYLPEQPIFMEFDWNNGRKSYCIRIKPKWPNTDVYIGADGAIDSRTDGELIEVCGPLTK